MPSRFEPDPTYPSDNIGVVVGPIYIEVHIELLLRVVLIVLCTQGLQLQV